MPSPENWTPEKAQSSGEQSHQHKQEYKLFALDSIQPTDDPIADFNAYDEEANQGRIGSMPDAQSALRALVSQRQGIKEALSREPDQGDDDFYLKYLRKEDEVLTRILEHHGVTVESTEDFDTQYGFFGSESQDEQKERFERMTSELDLMQPTENPIADLRNYDQIAYTGELQAIVTDPEHALKLLVLLRQTARDSLSKAIAHDDNYVPFLNLLKKEDEVLSRILDHYGIAAQNVNEFERQHERKN